MKLNHKRLYSQQIVNDYLTVSKPKTLIKIPTQPKLKEVIKKPEKINYYSSSKNKIKTNDIAEKYQSNIINQHSNIILKNLIRSSDHKNMVNAYEIGSNILNNKKSKEKYKQLLLKNISNDSKTNILFEQSSKSNSNKLNFIYSSKNSNKEIWKSPKKINKKQNNNIKTFNILNHISINSTIKEIKDKSFSLIDLDDELNSYLNIGNKFEEENNYKDNFFEEQNSDNSILDQNISLDDNILNNTSYELTNLLDSKFEVKQRNTEYDEKVKQSTRSLAKSNMNEPKNKQSTTSLDKLIPEDLNLSTKEYISITNTLTLNNDDDYNINIKPQSFNILNKYINKEEILSREDINFDQVNELLQNEISYSKHILNKIIDNNAQLKLTSIKKVKALQKLKGLNFTQNYKSICYSLYYLNLLSESNQSLEMPYITLNENELNELKLLFKFDNNNDCFDYLRDFPFLKEI